MKRTLIYSLKVWLTCVVVSPVLYCNIEALSESSLSKGLVADGGFFLYSLPFGLVLSLPSWVMFWLSLHSVNMLNWGLVTTKLLISVIAVILTALPFVLLFGTDDPGSDKSLLIWPVCYCLVLVAGVWYYKLRPSADALV